MFKYNPHKSFKLTNNNINEANCMIISFFDLFQQHLLFQFQLFVGLFNLIVSNDSFITAYNVIENGFSDR